MASGQLEYGKAIKHTEKALPNYRGGGDGGGGGG